MKFSAFFIFCGLAIVTLVVIQQKYIPEQMIVKISQETIVETQQELRRNYFSDSQHRRRESLHGYCKRFDPLKRRRNITYRDAFIFNDKHKVIYCRVPKVACTTWRRVFLMFQGLQQTLNEIHADRVHSIPLNLMAHSINKNDMEYRKNNYYSFMFSRHPHDRLFSAFRNKFHDPKNRTTYLEHYGPWMVFDHIKTKNEMKGFLKAYNINKKTLKVTFYQFVRFILKERKDLDPHWQPQTDICQPCHFKFNHIGKFETMNEDSKTIFDDINQPEMFKMFKSGDDTVYIKKTTELLRKHYSTLSKDMIRKINEYYKDDFEAFGYDPRYYLGDMGI